MAIVITDMLGTDSFSGSRIVINANFQSILSEVNAIELNFGMSVLAGNIDVSNATGGQILAKAIGANSIVLPASGTPTITLTGSSGAMTGATLVLSTSINTAAATINNLTTTALGNSVFNGQARFNALVQLYDGVATNKQDLGTIATHIVINTDHIVIFATASPNILTLSADPSLVDGHEITLVDKGTSGTILQATNILGFGVGSITFSAQPYKSSITLHWSAVDSKWLIISSSNMTIV